MSAQQAKKPQKSSQNQTPSPQITAEIAIIFGGLWLVGLGVIAVTKGTTGLLLATAMAGGDAILVVPFAAALLAYASASIAAGVKVLGEARRVDRYKQRLMAIYGTLAPLMLIGTFFVLSLPFSLIGSGLMQVFGVIDTGWIADLALPLLFSSIVLSGISLIWLWSLLMKKDKLAWVLETPKNASAAERRQLAHLAAQRQRGIYTMAVPVACLVVTGMMAFFSVFAGGGGGGLFFAAMIIEGLLFLYPTWLIFTAIGIKLLYASDYKE